MNPASQPTGGSDFQPHGYFEGRPYRFDQDGGIFSIRDGRVVRFADFEAFVTVPPKRSKAVLPVLLLVYGAVLCVSLAVVQHYFGYLSFVQVDPRLWVRAVVNVLPALGLVFLIVLGRASFGAALSFYLLTVAAGFSWLVPFSVFGYDRDLATLSIFASAATFALPAIFLKLPLPRLPDLSERGVERLLLVLLVASAVILAFASSYHFRLVGIGEIYLYRDQIVMPALLRYGSGIAVGALLPYAFTMFAARGRWAFAGLALAMLIGFYPVSLMKLALFAPFWLAFLYVLLQYSEERVAVVLSLLLPMAVGLATMAPQIFGFNASPVVTGLFGVVNFRMIAVPAISLDLYNDFFAHNPSTGFCQISWLKPFVRCPYATSLAELLGTAYQFGMLNASMFATEGIASVGLVAAPIVTFACGVVIAAANAMSRHWPQRHVILSAGIALQSFLSVPFSTMLLTNGAAVLFLLWYLTPPSYFQRDEQGRPSE